MECVCNLILFTHLQLKCEACSSFVEEFTDELSLIPRSLLFGVGGEAKVNLQLCLASTVHDSDPLKLHLALHIVMTSSDSHYGVWQLS